MNDGMVNAEVVEGREEDSAAMTDGSADDDDGEFKLTVRKLELPVRPRGVLAE